MRNKVIVVGALNYDVCLKLKRLPEEGETNFADSVEYCSGGKGGNQAVQAAKLGVTTYMAGCIGDDTSGVFLRENMEKYGVHTDFLKTVHGSSGMSVAQSLYDGGIRASVVLGANKDITKEDIDDLSHSIEPGDILVFQLEIPVEITEYAISIAKERKAFIILNGAPAAAVTEETLKKVDLFIVNEVEASFYAGRPIKTTEDAVSEIKAMSERYGNICIFTLGKAGSVVYADGKHELIPPRKVQAVESTGAGDSFIGGLCYALLSGMDIFSAAKFATCCSAKTVCKTGGQPAMPILSEVMELYGKAD